MLMQTITLSIVCQIVFIVIMAHGVVVFIEIMAHGVVATSKLLPRMIHLFLTKQGDLSRKYMQTFSRTLTLLCGSITQDGPEVASAAYYCIGCVQGWQ